MTALHSGDDDHSGIAEQALTAGSDTAFQLGVVLGGVQKAGTTSLSNYLRVHPQLLAPSRKETHFFDNERIDWARPNYRALRALYPASADDRIPFDATPIYLFWPPSLARIRAHNPAIKLIFLFRDPIERAWSHWRMEVRRDADTQSFSEAIRAGRNRLEGIAPLDPAWRVYSYVERGFYATQLRRLFDLFPREQVLLLSSHDLESDHAGVLARIAAFLGIAPFQPTTPRGDHRAPDDGETLDAEDMRYLRRIFRDEIAAFATLTDIRVDDWLTMRDA